MPIKKAAEIKFSTWAEAERALERLALLDVTERELTAAADEEINRIRGRLQGQLKNVNENRTLLEVRLREFAEERRGEFTKPKHKKLRFGEIGFRDNPKFKWPKKDTLIRRLKELKLGEYIKVEEKPDRQGIMAHWQELDLKGMGVSRKTADEFYIELYSEERTGE